MKIIDSLLYLEYTDLLNVGIPEGTIKSATSRKSNTWVFIKDPADKRKLLCSYDDLADKYKKLVQGKYNNPYEYMAKAPIKKLVETDFKAQSFYTSYRYDDNKSLPPDYIQSYTKAASWMNMIIKCSNDREFVKNTLKLAMLEFFDKVKEIIAAENIELPSSYKRLKEKMIEYQGEKEINYGCLIDWRFGSANGTKVKDELAQSVLFEMIAHPNQYDDVWISINYNVWAVKNNRKPIHEATVGNYRRRNSHLLTMQREGREKYYNKFSKSVKGFRPTTPLYLVESDDNHLDFFFTDWEDKTAHKHYHKFKAIVVTDSFNDYVLGYAYARELTGEVVKAAYLNAITHIKQLTGNYYLPHEVKTDRFAIGELEPLYHSLGNYYKTPVGSKRRGYIEQFFGSTLWKTAIKTGTNNYTGNNLTARYEGVNKEVLKLNKNEFPSVIEAPQFIEDFFERLRMMPDRKTGRSKQEVWLEAFKNTSADKLKPINDEEFLLKLGIVRKEKNTITTRGLDIAIEGQKINFDIPDQHYFEYKGKEVRTIYDPYDLSRVLVTDFEQLRFIATTPYYQPRAMADYKEGDRTILNIHLEGKRKHVALVQAGQDKRNVVLQESSVDIESLLSAGFLLKGDRQKAELSYQRKMMTGVNVIPERTMPINPIDKM